MHALTMRSIRESHRVEARRRFVEEQHLRVDAHARASECCCSPPTLRRPVIGVRLKSDVREHSLRARGARLRHASTSTHS
jgi:hypothetical protein